MENYTPQEIEELRERIIDYYGSATPLFAVAMGGVSAVENMDDEEIIEKAEEIGLI